MERRTDGPLMLVTAAAGKTGTLVAHELLERGQRVRALVRRVDARSKALESLGAQIVVGDMADVGQMEAALRGVERAYFCAPWEPHMLHMAEVFAQAARANGVNAIIEMTQWLSNPDHPSLATRQSWLITRMLASLPGVAHVVVNPGYFADNYLRLMPFAAHLGVLPNLTGDSRNAPPSNEDIARVIAACMLDPERHAGQTYRPTGPALLSVPEMAGIVGKVLGRSVRAVPLPWAMFAKAARAEGVSRFMVHELSFYVEEHRRGTFALAAPNDHVLRATGLAAEDFETSARRYAALPQAKRSFGALVAALAHQMRIGLTPGVNLAAYRKATQYPMPASPTYSDASPRWREEHGVPGAASGGQRVAGRAATPRMA